MAADGHFMVMSQSKAPTHLLAAANFRDFIADS